MVPVTDDRRVRIQDNFYHFPGSRYLFSHSAFIQEIQRNGFMEPPGSESVYVSSRIRKGYVDVCSCRNDFKCSDQKLFANSAVMYHIAQWQVRLEFVILTFPQASKALPDCKRFIFEVFF